MIQFLLSERNIDGWDLVNKYINNKLLYDFIVY